MPRIIITIDDESPYLAEFNSETIPRIGEQMVFATNNVHAVYYNVEHVGWIFHNHGKKLAAVEIRVTEVQQ